MPDRRGGYPARPYDGSSRMPKLPRGPAPGASPATPPQAGSVATPQKGTKEYETALLAQRYADLRAAVIRDGLPMLVKRIEAAELRVPDG